MNESLPANIQYVGVAATEWRHLSSHVHNRDYQWRLSQDEIDRLVSVYERMAKNGHELTLSKWLNANPSHPENPSLRDFLELFQVLYTKDILPANAWGLGFRYHEIPPLDWSKLPPELEFLREPAELYGDYYFDGDFYLLNWRLTESDKRWILERLMATWSVDEAYNAFFAKFPPKQHPESLLVGNFIDMCFQVDIGEIPDKPRQ